MKRVALYNLGCKVNSYELEVMRQSLEENGYEIVAFGEKADIYIVNTCTVTNIADRKSRQILHRARKQNPEAVVVAAGCYVETGREVLDQEGCIDLAVNNSQKKDMAAILEKYLEERLQKEADGGCPGLEWRGAGEESEIRCGETGSAEPAEAVLLKRPEGHTRAYIKIQDGCNQFCSYCIIPYARGRIRSRRPEEVLREIKGVVEAGFKEVVLTGIHLSSYGRDFGADGVSLPELIERIHDIQGLWRLRLGSLEPRIINRETARRLASLPKICPHFHLSLQSGCDSTLKRMNRHYTTGEYYDSVEALREYFDHPAVTTDVIVGFPGETEEEFEETKAFLEKARLYEMHIFKYSRRSGTVAAAMPDQVPEQTKTARSNELLAMEKRQSMEFRGRYIGKEAEVLLEERRVLNGCAWWIGHTKDYVKIAVEEEAVPKEQQAPNTLFKVAAEDFLTPEILKSTRRGADLACNFLANELYL